MATTRNTAERRLRAAIGEAGPEGRLPLEAPEASAPRRPNGPASSTSEGEDPAPPPPGRVIQTALLRICRQVQGIAKDGTAPDTMGAYRYTSVENMIETVRPLLLQEDIWPRQSWALLPLPEVSGVQAPEGAPAPPRARWLEVVLTLEHVPTGETLTERLPWPMVVQKGKPEDKAIATALSSSLTYWLRGLLMLPRGGDEMDGRSDAGYDPEVPPAAAPKTENSAARAAAPAQPRRQASSSSPGGNRDHVIDFGKNQGQRVRDLAAEDVRWHLERSRNRLRSPEFQQGGEKHRYRGAELARLRALEAEVLARGGQLSETVEG